MVIYVYLILFTEGSVCVATFCRNKAPHTSCYKTQKISIKCIFTEPNWTHCNSMKTNATHAYTAHAIQHAWSELTQPKQLKDKKQKIKESRWTLYPELFGVLAQRISLPNSFFESLLFSSSFSSTAPFRWLQHFSLLHIWHPSVLTKNPNKVHLHSQCHNILGVFSILTSICPYLVFFYPHTLQRKKTN